MSTDSHGEPQPQLRMTDVTPAASGSASARARLGRTDADGLIAPIFVTGSGRSGTTLVYRALLTHPELGWYSMISSRLPAVPQLSALSRLWPIVPDSLRGRTPTRFLGPDPEAIGIYDHFAMSDVIRHEHRSLTVADIDDAERSRFERHASSSLRWQGKRRLASKNTLHTARVAFLHGLFPDAHTVMVLRDPRAVVASLLDVAWWRDLSPWWADTTPRRWEADGADPVLFAARHVKTQIVTARHDASDVPATNHHVVHYESVLSRPEEEILELFDALGLAIDASAGERLAALGFRLDRRDRWRDRLNQREIRVIEDEFGPLLTELGYEPESNEDLRG